MANEISLSVSLALTRNSVLLANFLSGALSLNQAGSRLAQNIQSVLTTAVALQTGSIGTLGYVLVKSLDTSTNNKIYLLTTTGATSGAAFGELSAGEIACFKAGPGLTTPALIALSTATQAEVLCLEL